MHLETDYLYHIYNRGNNSCKVFFNHENYIFFLRKIRKHILPYCDILAWCLMPNHFHLIIRVKHTSIKVSEESNRMTRGEVSDRMTLSHPITNSQKTRTLNNSIGILLRSYSRAVQNQEDISGSLFQAKTKAECINCHRGLSPSWFQTAFGTSININIPEKQYPKLCFDYIHNNPVSAGLVKEMTGWEFSSARDYFGDRGGELVNRKMAAELRLV